MPEQKSRQKIYDELLKLLQDAELAARNGQWMTCGTYAKSCMIKAYEYGGREAAPPTAPYPEGVVAP